MLEFNLEKVPPSLDQIAAFISNLKKNRIYYIVGLAVATIGTGISGMAALVILFSGSDLVAALVSGSLSPYYNSTSCIICFFVAILFVGLWNAMMDKWDKTENTLSSLTLLDEESNQHLCPKVAEACGKDASCEAYRLAVAQMDRSLTVVEANLMINWADSAAERETQNERMRSNQLACVALRNKEAL